MSEAIGGNAEDLDIASLIQATLASRAGPQKYRKQPHAK